MDRRCLMENWLRRIRYPYFKMLTINTNLTSKMIQKNISQESSSSNMVDLLKPSHRRTTIQLWFMWLVFFCWFGKYIFKDTIRSSLLRRCHLHHSPSSLARRSVRSCRRSLLSSEKRRRRWTMQTSNVWKLHRYHRYNNERSARYAFLLFSELRKLIAGYILTMYAVDIIGRRATFAIGFAIVSACSAALTICLPRFPAFEWHPVQKSFLQIPHRHCSLRVPVGDRRSISSGIYLHERSVSDLVEVRVFFLFCIGS